MKKLEHALYVLLGTTAGLALLAMMLLAFVDVSARKLNMPIPGGVELTELLMIVLIFAGLPLVSMRGEHVTFDLFDRFMPQGLRAVLIRITQLFTGAAFWRCAISCGSAPGVCWKTGSPPRNCKSPLGRLPM